MKNNAGLKFINYLEDKDIYVLDYSGIITHEEGILRMEALHSYLEKEIPGNSIIRILLDVSKAQWDTIEVHNALSKTARQLFGNNRRLKRIILGVLNNELNCHADDSERWFTDTECAITWLSQFPIPE